MLHSTGRVSEENKIPNPGTTEAIEMGCMCPVMDNNYGQGAYGREGVYWYSADCPIHKWVDEEEE